MRLVPYAIAVAAARDPLPRRDAADALAQALALLALIFVVVRLGGRIRSAWRCAADDQQAKLEALDHVPMGARVVTFVGLPCGNVVGACRATAIWGRW